MRFWLWGDLTREERIEEARNKLQVRITTATQTATECHNKRGILTLEYEQAIAELSHTEEVCRLQIADSQARLARLSPMVKQ